uniref:dihydroxy-acid dehydratase n=1 Tax=viral metagenome TaxID=1070528 RepID=A0A6C0IW30_9ZZZZ
MSLSKISKIITNNIQNGAARSMLYGVGMSQRDMDKYLVGIGTMQFDMNPCNKHLGNLQTITKKSINKSDMVGLNFNTIGVSDGITNGNSGMSYSLPSRELIADSIETMINAHHYDGYILIPGCDKNLPASMMAMGRINRPSLLLYGGSMLPGNYKNSDVDIVTAFKSYGELIENKISKNERESLLKSCCNRKGGSCSGMYTCNTMASISEIMGFSLPYSSTNPAASKEKLLECKEIGNNLLSILDRNIKPKDVITKSSFENAIKITTVLGGSTNSVLHLLAIAHEFDIDLSLDDFYRINKDTPVLGNLKPYGKYSMNDIHKIGGLPMITKYLLDNNILDGNTYMMTGLSLQETIRNLHLPKLNFKQDVIKTIQNPTKKDGHIRIMKGNLCPEGAVGKISGNEGTYFKGPANIFSNEDDMVKALENKKIKKGDVVIIRGQGPKGGPGMSEMLKPSSALVGAGLSKDVALLTDGRWSGGSDGFLVGHITPEAYENGAIGYVENGDIITIDTNKNEINVDIDIERLQNSFTIDYNDAKIQTSYLKKYKKLVHNASEGCITY